MSRRFLIACWLLCGLIACPAGGAARGDILEKLDPQREVDLGREVARQVEAMLPLSSDQAVQARVERVGRALVEQLENHIYPYQFKVLALPEYNAFALPGGFIYVYEGVVDRSPDDDTLAFVLAHELTHACRRHWAKRTEDMKGINLLGAAAAEALGGDRDLLAALATSLIYLRYARADEYEADAAAMEYAWKAGFDPAGALTAMKEIVKLEQEESTPRYLRNHPPGGDRLRRLEQEYETLQNRPRPEVAAPPPAATCPAPDLPEVTPAENPWFPLAVGARWSYVVQKEGAERAEYTLEVVAEIPADRGKTWRGVVSFGDASVSCRLLTTRDQVWWRPPAGKANGEWRLRYATASGDGAAAGEGWEFRVMGMEAVSVPCGTFPEALRVQQCRTDGSARIDLWFVKGVGLVKRVASHTGVTEMLVDYWVPTEAGQIGAVGRAYPSPPIGRPSEKGGR